MQYIKLFILFGAPGSGKSESCNIFNKISKNRITIIKKETTRIKRNSDGDEIISVKSISKNCDFRYSQYGYDYGFKSQEIWNKLKQGFSCVLIVNDIRTIKMLNKKFGNLSKNIYIHSNIDKNTIEIIAKKRYPDKNELFLEKDTERRIEKIKIIHRKYIENTYLFNQTVINLYEENNKNSIHELEKQLLQVYSKTINNKTLFGSTSRIIIIAGGSFSGKDKLVNAMIQMEPKKVLSYQKGATRPKNKNDNDELLHLKKLNKRYNIKYNKNGYEYGLSSKDIWTSLAKEKIVLIVLSDLESIKKIKSIFQEICVVIYLHANIDFEELEKARTELDNKEFDKRKNSLNELHKTYISNMDIFNHVLLNTSESEDLYDQAFNILDFYLD
jgi:guanylate kinase